MRSEFYFEFFIPQINIIPVSTACTGQIEKELLTKGCLLGYMHLFTLSDKIGNLHAVKNML